MEHFKNNCTSTDIGWLLAAGSFCLIERAHASSSLNNVDIEKLEPVGTRSNISNFLKITNLGNTKYIAQIFADDYTHAMIVHDYMRECGADTNLLYDDYTTTERRFWYVTADKIPNELNNSDNHGVGDYFYEQAS
jgi:hypothetical protein